MLNPCAKPDELGEVVVGSILPEVVQHIPVVGIRWEVGVKGESWEWHDLLWCINPACM